MRARITGEFATALVEWPGEQDAVLDEQDRPRIRYASPDTFTGNVINGRGGSSASEPSRSLRGVNDE